MTSEKCCTPAPPAEHIDGGKEVTIGGVRCYAANPSSKTAVILVPGVMDIEKIRNRSTDSGTASGPGFQITIWAEMPPQMSIDAPLVRKVIDKIAAAGFYAIGPDFFHGDPYVPKDLANPLANFGPWIAVHHPDTSIDECKSIIKELKAGGIASIGLTGCCWGGRLSVMIGKEDDLAKAIVLLHPSFTTKENIEDLKVATAIFGAEIDHFTTPALVQEFKEILDTKPFPSSVKIFPGQTHGWTIKYDVNVPHEVKGAEEAHADMLSFYKNVL